MSDQTIDYQALADQARQAAPPPTAAAAGTAIDYGALADQARTGNINYNLEPSSSDQLEPIRYQDGMPIYSVDIYGRAGPPPPPPVYQGRDEQGNPIIARPPLPPPSPIPWALRKQTEPILSNIDPRTGEFIKTPALGTVPILDTAFTGPVQMAEGVAQATGGQQIDPVTGKLFQEPVSARSIAGGASKIFRGGLETLTPAMVGVGLGEAAVTGFPVATALTVGAGTGISAGTEKLLNAFGMPKEYSALISDFAGLFGAGWTYNKMRTLAKLPYVRESNAIQARLEEAIAQAKDPNATDIQRGAAMAKIQGLMDGLDRAEAAEPSGHFVPQVSPRDLRPGPRVKTVLTPQEQASQAYLTSRGIETPLSMQTGSKAAAGLEGVVQNLPGGGSFTERMQAAKQKLVAAGRAEAPRISPERVTPEEAGAAVSGKLAADLERTRAGLAQQVSPQPATAEEAGTAVSRKLAAVLENRRAALAQTVSPEPATPESAGTGIIKRGQEVIRQYDQAADEAYKKAWQAERDPRNFEDVPTGDLDENGDPVTESMPLPIDMRPIKRALKPLADRYEYTLRETDARASLGLKAMRNIIGGPDYKPASAAELDLGMLKDAARTEKGLKELRDPSQGLAAASVGELQKAIDGKLAGAEYPGFDPESGGTSPALQNLRAGRKATAQKHDVADVFGKFGRNIEELEPVGVYNRMIWQGDSGIEHMRDVAKIAPDAMPQVGRAFIDAGGNWENLGPETKKMLFRDPDVIKGLDQYYADQARFGPLTKMEPAQLFNRLTAGGGTRLNLLRDVATKAPELMPQMGRAFIDSGGDWERLDPESKKLLFKDPDVIKGLDKYYEDAGKYTPLTKLGPVDFFNRLTAGGGTRVHILRDVAQQTPEQIPGLARAWMEGLLDRVTREGDIQKIQSTLDAWHDLDPESKRILFRDPKLINDLNDMFFSLKRIVKNPNPSGSGFIFALTKLKGDIFKGLGLLGSGVGGAVHGGATEGVAAAGAGYMGGAAMEYASNAALARLLFNRRFTQLMTRGMQEQLRGNREGVKLTARELLRMTSEEPPPEEGPPTGGGTPPNPPPAPPGSTGGAVPTETPGLGEKIKGGLQRVWQEEEGSLTLPNLRKADLAAGSEQSTRVPTAVRATEDPLSNILTTGYQSWARDPEMLRKNVSAMLDYPNFRDLQAQVRSGALSIPDAAEHIIGRIQDNLQWLHDSMPENFRDRARLWYDGAHTIARKWAGDYGATPEQVAASMAVTSPGTDWFVNAERARRLLEFWQDRGNKAWDPRMAKTWRDKVSNAVPENQQRQVYRQIQGKSFNDAQAIGPREAAIWFRLYDEAVNPREYHTLTPEGKAGDLARIGSGDPRQFSWSDFGQIQKTLSILEDGSRENIHKQLGQEHKVRNFYNNIINPDSPREHTTIDTHAVAAGLVRPLSQMSTEVGHNFGGAGSSSSSVSGESGTYALHKEAYRRAAAANDLLPREMQSITWEAIRSMFSPAFKRNPANVEYINSLWQDVSDGKITADAARQRALQFAGGFDRPAWFRGRWNPGIPKEAGLPNKPR